MTTQAPALEGIAPAIRKRAWFSAHAAIMAAVGVKMMFHDRMKLVSTLTGVIFAVVLSNQQGGTFLGLIYKNVMAVRNIDADLWIMPPGTNQFQAVRPMSTSILYTAETTPGVEWTAPLLYGTGSMALANGGTEGVNIIGTKQPRFGGGPWNLVSGDVSVLARPDTMIFEDSEREKYGGLNVGSVREINGIRVTAGGFTWGLLPFGPAFAFAEFDLARDLLKVQSDQLHYVIVKAAPGADVERLKAALTAALPHQLVKTRAEYERMITLYILTRTPIGFTYGLMTAFGFIIGFIIVSLSMFSAVLDNLREFGTLKAIGATNGDLAVLIGTQSVVYAVLGSILGLALVTRIGELMRSPKLGLVLLPEVMGGTVTAMIVLCLAASLFAVGRIRKLEPGMVFR